MGQNSIMLLTYTLDFNVEPLLTFHTLTSLPLTFPPQSRTELCYDHRDLWGANSGVDQSIGPRAIIQMRMIPHFHRIFKTLSI